MQNHNYLVKVNIAPIISNSSKGSESKNDKRECDQ